MKILRGLLLCALLWPIHLTALTLGPSEIEKLESWLYPENSPLQTEAAVVLFQGDVIYETYARGFQADQKHLLWSISKSIQSTIFGAAEKAGFISRADRLHEFFPEVNHPALKELSIEHLLYWSSGLDWRETYEQSPIESSVIQMLYGKGRENMGGFALSHSFRFPPGEVFDYSSGDSNLAMEVLRRRLPPEIYELFPWTAVFDPLEISATWEQDQVGNFIGSSFVYMSARDLAKIGQLYVQNGLWKGQQIFHPSWVRFSRQVSPAFLRAGKPREKPTDPYPGGHWWVNADLRSQNLPWPWPQVPSDALIALGHWGQSLVIVRSAKLVVVRLANDRSGNFDHNAFVGFLYQQYLKARRER